MSARVSPLGWTGAPQACPLWCWEAPIGQGAEAEGAVTQVQTGQAGDAEGSQGTGRRVLPSWAESTGQCQGYLGSGTHR